MNMPARRTRFRVVQIRVTLETWNSLASAAPAIFGVTRKQHFLNHACRPAGPAALDPTPSGCAVGEQDRYMSLAVFRGNRNVPLGALGEAQHARVAVQDLSRETADTAADGVFAQTCLQSCAEAGALPRRRHHEGDLGQIRCRV